MANTDDVRISKEGNALKYYEPLKLDSTHKTIVALRATGLKPGEIANIVGLSGARVSVILNHPDAQPLLAQLTTDHINNVVSDVDEMIKGSAGEAYLKVVDLMRNSGSEKIQMDCAMDLLDRAGFTAKTQQAPPQPQFGDQGAAKIVQALKDSKREITVPREATGKDLTVDAELDFETV